MPARSSASYKERTWLPDRLKTRRTPAATSDWAMSWAPLGMVAEGSRWKRLAPALTNRILRFYPPVLRWEAARNNDNEGTTSNQGNADDRGAPVPAGRACKAGWG